MPVSIYFIGRYLYNIIYVYVQYIESYQHHAMHRRRRQYIRNIMYKQCRTTSADDDGPLRVQCTYVV